jgi:hypothetical protein
VDPDEIYEDRNLLAQLAAALAQMLGLASGVGTDPNEPDWPVIYLDLPTGQVSWHIPQHELVAHLEPYLRDWDGHSSADKRDRIRQFLDKVRTSMPSS